MAEIDIKKVYTTVVGCIAIQTLPKNWEEVVPVARALQEIYKQNAFEAPLPENPTTSAEEFQEMSKFAHNISLGARVAVREGRTEIFNLDHAAHHVATDTQHHVCDNTICKVVEALAVGRIVKAFVSASRKMTSTTSPKRARTIFGEAKSICRQTAACGIRIPEAETICSVVQEEMGFPFLPELIQQHIVSSMRSTQGDG